MHIMASHAFYLAIIQFNTVIKTIRCVRWTEISVFKCKPGVLHGNGVIVAQVAAKHLDGDVVSNIAVVTFAATLNVVFGVDAHVHGVV